MYLKDKIVRMFTSKGKQNPSIWLGPQELYKKCLVPGRAWGTQVRARSSLSHDRLESETTEPWLALGDSSLAALQETRYGAQTETNEGLEHTVTRQYVIKI